MGPLNGLKLSNWRGLVPVLCGMMLADMGAEVIRVGVSLRLRLQRQRTYSRNRRSIPLLENPEGVETVLRLVESADGLIEGFARGHRAIGLGPSMPGT